MGAAAAVAMNPLLLSLVTISGASSPFSGRRRRSLTGEGAQLGRRLHQLRSLRRFLSGLPGSPVDRLAADYLVWSGLQAGGCLELLSCSYAANTTAVQRQPDREVVSIVLYNLMTNRAVGGGLKARLRGAARAGRDGSDCLDFSCSQAG
jgi:hypothetical protein